MFLKAWGVDGVSAARVKTVTPRNSQGTSMLELQQTARRFGVETAIYKCGVEDLGTNCPLPAIGLFKPGGRTGGGRHYAAHYSLIIDVQPGPDGKVTWIDGTFGDRFIRPKSQFTDQWWDEYVLVARETSTIDRTWIAVAMLGTVVHACFWVFVRRNRSRRRASVRWSGAERCTV
jgi:hypothetical protein